MVTFDELFRSDMDDIGFQVDPFVGKSKCVLRFSHGDQAVHCNLSWYERRDLLSLPVFKEAVDAEPEWLISKWFTRISPGVIIKFASDKELALVLEFEGASEENLKKLARKAAWLLKVGTNCKEEKNNYFQELCFAWRLNSLNLSIETLRTEHRFSRKELFLLAQRWDTFEVLLKQGLSIQEIKGSFSKWMKMWDLDSLLSLITIGQILGKEHTPPPAPEKAFQRARPLSDWSRGTQAEFSYSSSNNECNITYHDNKKLIIRVITPEESDVSRLDAEVEGREAERLIHDWYHLPGKHSDASDYVERRIYCPELKLVVIEQKDPLLTDERMVSPKDIDDIYYKEKRFAAFLQNRGSSLEMLRKTSGMTATKLSIMCEDILFVSYLLKKGMKLTDFAMIDENRLRHVFKHSRVADTALKYVSVSELFDQKRLTSAHSSGRFFSSVSTEIEESCQDDEDKPAVACSSVPY